MGLLSDAGVVQIETMKLLFVGQLRPKSKAQLCLALWQLRGRFRVVYGDLLGSFGTPWPPFLALKSVRGRLGGHLGRGFKKTSKKSLLETILLDQICDRCWHFCGDVFHMFSKPLYFHLFALAGAHMTQFRRLLATKLGTD